MAAVSNVGGGGGIKGWMCVDGSNLAVKNGRAAFEDEENETLASLGARFYVQNDAAKGQVVRRGTTKAKDLCRFKLARPTVKRTEWCVGDDEGNDCALLQAG